MVVLNFSSGLWSNWLTSGESCWRASCLMLSKSSEDEDDGATIGDAGITTGSGVSTGPGAGSGILNDWPNGVCVAEAC